MWLPGVGAAAAAAIVAWVISTLVPGIPLLTASVALGILVAQLPAARPALTGVLAPGLSLASKRLMRIGVVLLGLKLSLVDIAALGWVAIGTTVAVVVVTFAGTYWLGRWFRLPGHQPLLIATGFAICGASAIGAVSGVIKAKDEETAVPVALVTLFGTLAIVVLPALWHPLGLSSVQFGHWVGAGVHDVGQVVASAQIAGTAALAVAVVVKLTRVVMLAPVIAVVSVVERRRVLVSSNGTTVAPDGTTVAPDGTTQAVPVMPLFVAGFLVAVLVRTVLPVPGVVLAGADVVQTVLLAMALFGLGASVRLGPLLRTGWRALLVGLLSWSLIAALAYAAVQLA
ncbi:MAG TPA: putative sulfate exporter family transporter [Glaciibacter sp.]|nr:putative sulfate exporter family transporter [Glaciibacter sp.]